MRSQVTFDSTFGQQLLEELEGKKKLNERTPLIITNTRILQKLNARNQQKSVSFTSPFEFLTKYPFFSLSLFLKIQRP